MIHINGYYERESTNGNSFYISYSGENCCLPHFHESIELVFCFEDGFRLKVNGEEYILRKGDIAFIESLSIHHFEVQKLQTFVLRIGADYFNHFRQVAGTRTFPVHLEAKPGVSEKIFSILEQFHSCWRDSNELLNYGLVDFLFGILLKHYSLTPVMPRTNVHIITEILYDIEENLTQPISIQQMAEKYGYNKTYLSSLFNEYLGVHFKDYVNRLRIELAKQFLEKKQENNDTMLNIAGKCGFDSMNTFYRAWKKFGNKKRTF